MLSFTNNYDWDAWIPYYTFAYNITPHTKTGYSPFELVYGRLATLPSEVVQSNIFYNYDSYLAELKAKMQHAQSTARNLLNSAKIAQKQNYDKNVNTVDFQVGDSVYLKAEDRKKNESPYKGPYKIVETNGVNSLIEINNTNKLVHNNRLKKKIYMYKKTNNIIV